MSEAPQHTRFVSRGRLNGVLRQNLAGGGPADAAATQPGREQHAVDELDTQTFEALYYRARLILGEPLARPGRFQGRGR
jgi:hypothetical protein